MSLVRYELGFYIPEGGILHCYRCENFKCYTEIRFFTLYCMVLSVVRLHFEQHYVIQSVAYLSQKKLFSHICEYFTGL
jgi:hypothetical protein